MKVSIMTPARLHLGIIDTCGELGRIYGSIGITIDKPNVELEATPSRTLGATGLDAERTIRIARRFIERFPKATNADINVTKTIPEHAGLGSGTQLSLAVGKAIAAVSALDLSVREIASALGRGRVSGIGVGAFEHGGFILDTGRRNGPETQSVESSVSLTVFQRKFPEEWRFVVAIPNVGKGLFGRAEQEAFSALPPASPELVGKICRIVIMRMLPSLIEQNIREFGESVTTVQDLVGESFSRVQGGLFFSPLVEDSIHFMLRSGAYGAGQSSWGPAMYGITESSSRAEMLKQRLEGFLNERGGGSVFVAKANNDGARTTTSDA